MKKILCGMFVALVASMTPAQTIVISDTDALAASRKLYALARKAGHTEAELATAIELYARPAERKLEIRKWVADVPVMAISTITEAEADVVLSVPQKYWKTVDGAVTEMTAAEKKAVDQAGEPAAVQSARGRYRAITKQILKAVHDPRQDADPTPWIKLAELEGMLDTLPDVQQARLAARLGLAAVGVKGE